MTARSTKRQRCLGDDRRHLSQLRRRRRDWSGGCWTSILWG
jgi:hypothetical protein